MITRPSKVQTKLVRAMDREVSVGEWNSKSEKIEAETYMSEFYIMSAAKSPVSQQEELTKPHSCCSPWSKQAIVNALLLPPT